jgi:propanol-preferring alcohol dehydrogenase
MDTLLNPMSAMHGAQVALNMSHDLIQPEAALLGSEYFRFNEMPVNFALLQNNCGYLGQIIAHRSI